MITGTHALIFTPEADALRVFLRDVLGFGAVDAGDGWPIFALPPAELGVHPDEGANRHELYLMCDDINSTMAELKGKGVEFTQGVSDQGWGLATAFKIPGGEMALYEPRHPTAAKLLSKAADGQARG
jgi:hypothetical protein